MKTNKWNVWWDSLPAHTREYLEAQPIWHTREMLGVSLTTFVIGIILGSLFTWM